MHQASLATNSSGSSNYNNLSVFQNPRQLFRKSGSAETNDAKAKEQDASYGGASDNSHVISSPGLPNINGSDSSDYVAGARLKKREVKLIEVKDIDEEANEEEVDDVKDSSGGTGDQLAQDHTHAGCDCCGKIGHVREADDTEEDTGLRRI